jgi:DNA uptake protein ComE-like DNA-binding protein
MRQFIRDYFTFNKRERNGIVVLSIIIVLELLYLAFSNKFLKPEAIDFTAFEKEIQQIEAASQNKRITFAKNNDTLNVHEMSLNKEVSDVRYFKFNPNNLSEQSWQQLGLSEKQIRVIKNYEAKGGKFFTKQDVKKMYCISADQYAELEAFIDIPEKKSKSEISTSSTKITPEKSVLKNRHSEVIELNTADSIQLVQLKGIGAFYAKAIIKLRNSLGGFVTKNQLLELWKFDESKLKLIEENISVDASKVKKRNINTLTSKELKHPYLQWNQVNAIVNYKNKHGNYHSVEEIKNTDVIDEETYLKISPYLTVD